MNILVARARGSRGTLATRSWKKQGRPAGDFRKALRWLRGRDVLRLVFMP